MSQKITFVCPLRGREEMRPHFEKNVQKYFDNYEIIFVYQDDTKPFMVAQLRNIGFHYANTEYVVYRDVDVMDLDSIDLIGIYLKFNKPYRTYNKRLQIKVLENEKFVNYEKRAILVPGFGGYCVFRKEDWLKYNGFTNLCIDWGYEDNITKYVYNMQTYNRTFGHIYHASSDKYDLHAAINKQIYKMYLNKQISSLEDGYKQMKYDVISDEYVSENIREIHINNIIVIPEFKYMNLYKKHLTLMNKK